MKEKHSLFRVFFYICHSISTKIILIILILVLPLNILTIFLSSIAVKNVEEQAKLSVLNVMENYMVDVEKRMEEIGYLLYSMQKNDTNATIMAKQKGDYHYNIAKYKFFKTFNDTFMIANVSDGAFYYMGSIDDIIVWDKNTTIHTKMDMQTFIKKRIKRDIQNGWIITNLPGSNLSYVEYPVLWQFIKLSNLYYGGFIELDGARQYLKSVLPYSIGNIHFSNEKIMETSGSMILISNYWKKADLYFSVEIDRNEVNGSIHRIYTIIQYAAFLALLLIPFLYFGISRILLVPLKIVNRAHTELENGNQDFRITMHAKSIEYRHTFESFNRMADSIKSLKVENYEKELDKQKVVLRNLQLQIRPHFLINAFNLIYTLAERNDSQHVQEIILYLSDYFRYIFRSKKELELFGKEQKLIEGYINMAQVRYPDSIEFSHEYDPEISFVRVPPLLIHNFVENIIKHVVKQGEMTHIMLAGEYNEGMVTFLVMDDGCGMDENQMKVVDERMRRGKIDGTSVGMANAYRRLKSFYGGKANIEITSEIGIGTSIIISFPYNLEEKDESADSE